jgi:hypothetical protein
VTLGMQARGMGHFDRIKDAAGTAVLAYEIDLTSRQSRVHDHRPGIDLRGGEDQRDQREAVLPDDHDPVAGPNPIVRKSDRRRGHDRRQVGIGPGHITLHQGGVVWTVARERLDDVADPIRKLGQDLLHFVPRRRPAHARLAALIAPAKDGDDNRCDFKTVNPANCYCV